MEQVLPQETTHRRALTLQVYQQAHCYTSYNSSLEMTDNADSFCCNLGVSTFFHQQIQIL